MQKHLPFCVSKVKKAEVRLYEDYKNFVISYSDSRVLE